MQDLSLLIAAFFLPLFPFGMIFNALFQRLPNVPLRVSLLLLWPLPGIWILQSMAPVIPVWLTYWALCSALLYGFRAVVVKDFRVWIGFLASSTWALSWIALSFGAKPVEVFFHVLAFSLPLLLLILLVAELEKRYESAYVSVISGLAQALPRLSVLLVITMLAAIGSPIFPAFVSMLDTVSHAIAVLPSIAIGLVIVWLLWSWSGIELLQQLLIGTSPQVQQRDISQPVMMIYTSLLLLLAIGGLYLSRVLL